VVISSRTDVSGYFQQDGCKPNLTIASVLLDCNQRPVVKQLSVGVVLRRCFEGVKLIILLAPWPSNVKHLLKL